MAMMLAVISTGLMGCQGSFSSKPPVHLNPNMDHQPAHQPQTLSQLPPDHTVRWERTPPSQHEATGKTSRGWAKRPPMEVTEAVILRGQDRYGIYCAICHDNVGSGKTTLRPYGLAPSLHLASKQLRETSDGALFDTITNGKGTMSGYSDVLSIEDRWAIVTYVRALQRAYETPLSDLSDEQRRYVDEQLGEAKRR